MHSDLRSLFKLEIVKQNIFTSVEEPTDISK